MTKHKYAEMAYSTYKRASNGKCLVTGQLLPVWDNLPIPVKDAWFAATEAIIEEYNREFEDDLK